MFIVSCIFLLFYVLLISIYHIGWILIPYYKQLNTQSKYSFTILVPARNEEHTIQHCLQSLINQNYTGQFEILIINDYSTDSTAQQVNAFIKESKAHHVRLINLAETSAYHGVKKAGITYGISCARSEYIILTDADCTRGENWLTTINSFIGTHKSKMIYAPVMFNANNMFERIQALEFSGLVAIGGAAIQLKNPNMCSAANLIFSKQVFVEVEGYKGNENIASGDDEFLLHKVFKRYPNDIHFLKHRDAVVYTTANASVKQLTEQRRRWVSKSMKYENRYITAILIAAYLFNVMLFVNLLNNLKLGLLLLGVKAVVEGLFLFNVLSFFNRRRYLLLLPIAEIFHIIYVIVIGIWANVSTYSWKNRKLK
jgi:glycosyltransferase involved in cell wall biosynthesis